MRWANTTADKAEATPGARGTCPVCDDTVIAKCGKFVTHHWAHKARSDCDSWSEPESQWHRDWKDLVTGNDPSKQEITIGPHRADAVWEGRVIELQHSPITIETIKERESFYGDMVWVVDACTWEIGETEEPFPFLDGLGDWFRWKRPRKSYWYAGKPLFLDLGNGEVLFVTAIQKRLPCYFRAVRLRCDEAIPVIQNPGHWHTTREKRLALLAEWYPQWDFFKRLGDACPEAQASPDGPETRGGWVNVQDARRRARRRFRSVVVETFPLLMPEGFAEGPPPWGRVQGISPTMAMSLADLMVKVAVGARIDAKMSRTQRAQAGPALLPFPLEPYLGKFIVVCDDVAALAKLVNRASPGLAFMFRFLLSEGQRELIVEEDERQAAALAVRTEQWRVYRLRQIEARGDWNERAARKEEAWLRHCAGRPQETTFEDRQQFDRAWARSLAESAGRNWSPK